MSELQPITHEEQQLAAVLNGTEPLKPILHEDLFYAALAKGELPTEKPITRKEMFLKAIAEKGLGGGGESVESLIDRSITKVSSNVTAIEKYMFANCKSLISVSLPNVKDITESAFQGCRSLVDVYIPSATSIDSSAFKSCLILEHCAFPLVSYIDDYAFQSCIALKTIDLSKQIDFRTGAFSGAFSLVAVILRSESMCYLNYSDVFKNCHHILGNVHPTYNPDGLKDGYFYVPRSLVESYKSHVKWGEFSTQFRALEDFTVDGTITGKLDQSKI